MESHSFHNPGVLVLRRQYPHHTLGTDIRHLERSREGPIHYSVLPVQGGSQLFSKPKHSKANLAGAPPHY
eukprot:1329945-Amphidinium_carterae.1